MTVLDKERGTLRQAMERVAKVAVLVVDESGSGDTDLDPHKEILFAAAMYGHPVAFIEFDNSSNGYPSITTAAELKNMAPSAPVFTKTQSNGFIDTGLAEWLKQSGATQVVVMGMEANCCVRALVLGGWTVARSGTAVEDPGLVGRNYGVMTAYTLLRSDPPNWDGHPRVEFYHSVNGD